MVLVVDDDKSITEALKTLLAQEGFTVKTATNGGEAYAYAKSPDCKCMLLDINMPHINGVELLLILQSEGVKLPTIVMAGMGDFSGGEMKQFANVRQFFRKPFDMDDMLKTVQTYAKV